MKQRGRKRYYCYEPYYCYIPYYCYCPINVQDTFVEVVQETVLDESGKASVTFETGNLQVFTFCIRNFSTNTVKVLVDLSPNLCDFWADTSASQDIGANGVAVVLGKIFMRYTKLDFEGEPGASICIYLQGQRG